MRDHSTWTTGLLAKALPCLALLILCSATSPVYGDDILSVDMSNILFQAAAGNDSCNISPTGAGMPCQETFNITFQWDNTTESLVGTPSVNGTGALSAADIAGPWTINDDGAYTGGIGLVVNEFPGPDYISIFDADFVTPLVPGIYAGSDAFMACFEAPSECDTLFDYDSGGGTTPPGYALSGTVTISTPGTVPEPGTFALLFLGMCLGGVGMLYRRTASYR